ncbi:MAG: bifunctional (p)ppGpp synthetase/guanosine-3',5'-bis(diphosphate) 3'-pyrophosphohydrolase [Clostridia bacterium]|nr:bifunctional (p)ppGpp synthetase/guanosine-3',5'-bis(diphosphate) 3'-pyrophosphohydrolase [Clostridia bacterium]
MDIETIIEVVKSYNKKADISLIKKAYDFALEAHRGQYRLSGEEYIEHPLNVALILAELELDVATIAAGILHDVVEDTEVTLEEIKEEFGEEIALLIDGVTKLSRIEFTSKEEQQVENLRKMFLAMAKDIRVILIKLADRLHNMRTLAHQSKEKQKEISEETLEIFAPLAHRLGIFRIKWELEDLSLRFLNPNRYYDLVKKISKRRQEREEYINKVIEILKEELEKVNIKADISGRPKHFYSIYNKMVKKGKSLNEIYDLIAVRVIVNSVKDCYGVLGIIHALWKPIPGRFKDYIAMPKPNMYQSLHTTVIGPQGEPIEVQIRTWEMHRTAEYGIAAHWKYKNQVEGDEDFEKKLSWLRQLLEWQRDMKDAREFMESLKIDFFSDRVYVFTPKGDVVELPAGSVPIDFAYKVHTQVGHTCVGAKVNGKIVPLDYKLKTGDIVEIITSKGSGPSRDWLNIVQTSQAKNRIRNWFKKIGKEDRAAKGKELLEKEVLRNGLKVGDVVNNERLLEVGKRFNLSKVEDVYAAIGDGTITPQQVISRIKEKYLEDDTEQIIPEIKPARRSDKSSKGVRVKGVGDIMVRLARCCNPLPGDDIVGYITRGRGITIHRSDCPNILYYRAEEEQRILDEVSWDTNNAATYRVAIEIEAIDRPRLAADIMNVVADSKIVINAINARAVSNKLALLHLKVEVKSLEQMDRLMEKLRRVHDVLEVRRVVPRSESRSKTLKSHG